MGGIDRIRTKKRHWLLFRFCLDGPLLNLLCLCAIFTSFSSTNCTQTKIIFKCVIRHSFRRKRTLDWYARNSATLWKMWKVHKVSKTVRWDPGSCFRLYYQGWSKYLNIRWRCISSVVSNVADWPIPHSISQSEEINDTLPTTQKEGVVSDQNISFTLQKILKTFPKAPARKEVTKGSEVTG